ncbi:hypothetical protein L5515_009308 [Caenorhabditis briggsae]|uniref:Uncharacterized protein n=1 Tax=Caenorhabditis briggsae TaxID=6238 RepID=A0AAE9F374_CAEBR|nr:hypothetical protein L5515_009308 [Caenorhabditis briggsae]
MPIRILSFPIAVLQNALECMDIRDLVAFSRKDNHVQILVSSRNSNAEPRMERIHQRFIVNLLSSSCAKSAVPVYIIFASWSAEESNAFDEISKKEKY